MRIRLGDHFDPADAASVCGPRFLASTVSSLEVQSDISCASLQECCCILIEWGRKSPTNSAISCHFCPL